MKAPRPREGCFLIAIQSSGYGGILTDMKNVYKTFKKTIYNPAFYQNITSITLSESFRYYFKCTIMLAAVMTIALALFFIPAGSVFIKKDASGLVKNYYPADLTVHFEKGEASTNVVMPYLVPVPGVASTTTAMKNLLVIDTQHEFDKKTFEGFKTYALLTKTDLITGNDNGQITIQSLRAVPTGTISQGMLLSLIEKAQQLFVPLVIVGVIVLFVILVLGYLIYLVPLLLFALVPLLISWIRKAQLSYGAAFRMSLHAIVPALVIKTALNLLGLFFLPSYLTFLIFMLIIAINIRDTEQPKLLEV